MPYREPSPTLTRFFVCVVYFNDNHNSASVYRFIDAEDRLSALENVLHKENVKKQTVWSWHIVSLADFEKEIREDCSGTQGK